MAEESSSSKPENNSQGSSKEKEWYDYASLRILCLHGDKSNAKKTHRTLQSLDRRLFENHGVELVSVLFEMRKKFFGCVAHLLNFGAKGLHQFTS